MSAGVPGVFGAGIAVPDSAALALLSTRGLTPGTKVWNADVGAYFILTVPSTASLVTDEIVEVYRTAGARWIIQAVGNVDIDGDLDVTGAANVDGIITTTGGLAVVETPAIRFGAWLTPTIDWTTPATIPCPNSTRAGFYFIASHWAVLWVATAGTLSVTPTWKMGNDASNVNMQVSQSAVPSVAQFNIGAPGKGSFSAASHGTLVDMTTPASVVITVGGSGTGLTMTGKLLVVGYWILATDYPGV